MSFTILRESKQEAGLCQLEAAADMSIYAAAACHQSLMALLPRYSRFELDLSRVEEIDSSGVQLLMAVTREAERSDKTFSLHSASPAVTEVLQLLNLRDSLHWAGSADPGGSR